MNFSSNYLNHLLEWLNEFLPHLIYAVAVFFAGRWLVKFLSKVIIKAMERAGIGKEVTTFVHSFTKNALLIILYIYIFSILGFNVTSLVTALGAATVAIGLAIQDSLKNVAGGMMILANQPFKVGDFLETDGLQGTVTRIDIANTRLITKDNKEIIIPNSKISSNNIVNYSSQQNRRVDLSYCVSYNTDIDKVKNVVKSVIDKNDKIFTDPPVLIGVGKHGDSSIEIIVWLWCKTSDYWDVYFYMQENIKKAFDANKIEIPFTQIDIHNS